MSRFVRSAVAASGFVGLCFAGHSYKRSPSSRLAHCEAGLHEERSSVADVVVIGGGIAGASAALALAQRDASVVVLEKGTVACEASSLAAGTVWVVGRSSVAKPTFKDYFSFGTRVIAFDLLRRYAVDPETTASGALLVASTRKQADLAASVYKQLNGKGYHVELLSREKSIAVEPMLKDGDTISALFAPLSFHCNPNSFTHALADAARQQGAEFREGQEVLNVTELVPREEDNARFLVRTKGLEFRCRNIVVASGCDLTQTLDNCGVALGNMCRVVPVKGQIWATDLVEDTGSRGLSTMIFGLDCIHHWVENKHLEEPQLPKDVTHNRTGERLSHHIYGRMTSEGQILFGGDRFVDMDRDYLVDDQLVEENYARVMEMAPSLGKLERAGAYCCYMPFTMDGRPIVGPTSKKGIFVLGGFGAHGIAMAPMAGQLLAKQMLDITAITEQEAHVLCQVDPSR